MTEEKLKQMRAALKMLEELQLPVSKEQRQAIHDAEYEYIDDELVPLIKEEVLSLIANIESPFKIEMSFTKDKQFIVKRVDDSHVAEQPLQFAPSHEESRKKSFIIKVTFPDGTVYCDRIVKNTIVDTIRHIGCKKVYDLQIPVLGMYLVDVKRHENPRYAATQTEIEPGYFILMTGDSDRKIDHLRNISNQLNLGLKIEKVPFETMMSREALDRKKQKRSKRTTYSLEGSKFTTKSFFVLEIVERILSYTPDITFDELEKLMPLTSQNNRTLIKCTEWAKKSEDAKGRYISYMTLTTGDGIPFYVSSQWTQETFEKKIYPLLKNLGYSWEEK